MRTSIWIKIIGILCIVFGGFGIISNILEILLPNLVEMSGDQSTQIPPELMAWIVRLAYIGLVVNAIYIVAGILFLAKKPISIKFMYFALSISILYAIVPLIFLRRYPATFFYNYEFNVSNLIGPFIDIAIFAAVIWISNHYFIPDPERTNKRPLTNKQLKVISLIGILCLFIPVSFHLLWIYAFNAEATSLESFELFKSYLPGFLHGQYTITLLGISLCAVAIILSSIGMQSRLKPWRVLNILVLSFSIPLLLLNLFQMM